MAIEQIKKIIDGDRTNPQSSIARNIADLFDAGYALHQMAELHIRGKKRMSLKLLDTSLRALFTQIDATAAYLPTLRKVPSMQAFIPKGMPSIMNKMKRVGRDIYQHGVSAGKADRMPPSEVAEAIGALPMEEFAKALADSYKQVMNSKYHRDGVEIDTDKELRKRIDVYRKEYANLPTSLSGKLFQAFRCPVVPLFSDMSVHLDPKKVELLDLDIDVMEDNFMVIKDQMVIAFDHKRMEWFSGFKKDGKGNVRVQRIRGQRLNKEDNKISNDILEVIEQINKRSSTRYSLASTNLVPNPRNANMWMAWVIPEKTHQRLLSVLSTTEIKWGLPFNLSN